MVQCGVVWCGVVCGMVWCGVVWCGMVWCGVVCGMVWCGVVWCGVVRCGVWYGVVWCGMVWCDMGKPSLICAVSRIAKITDLSKSCMCERSRARLSSSIGVKDSIGPIRTACG